MERVFAEIGRLRAAGARHRRSGLRLSDVDPASMIDRMIGELEELRAQPADIYELADVFCVALHYAQEQGWSLGDLERAMHEKLAQRFTTDT